MNAVPDNQALRLYRKYLGASQSELASLMGTTQTTVARWESGDVPVTRLALSYVKTLVELKLRKDLGKIFAQLVPELSLCDFDGLLGYPSSSFTLDTRGNCYLGTIEVMGHREHGLYVNIEDGQLYALDRTGTSRLVDREFLRMIRLRGTLREESAKSKDDPLVQRNRIKRIAVHVLPNCEVAFDTAQPFTWIRFRLDDARTGKTIGAASGHFHASEIADWSDERLRTYIEALSEATTK